MLRRERKHFERKSRRFESSTNEDRRQAVINFFGADPDMVDVSTVDGFNGPVTEVTFNGNVYWVMTDSEAEREATAHFLDTFTDGSMIEHDPDLCRLAERTDLWNSDAVLDAWLAENDRDDAPDDDDEIYEWVEDNYSISELWDMEVIDREAFCKELWEVYGYGHELDIEGHTESEEVGGVYYNIFLIEGEWKYESRCNMIITRKRRVEIKTRKVCSIPCILKSNRRRHFEDSTDGLSDAVDVIEGKDKFDARAFKFEVRAGNSNGLLKNGKFIGKLSASLTMRYEGAECSVSITDTKAEMTVEELQNVSTTLYAVTVSTPATRRDVTIEREGDGYVIHIAADCTVDCPETVYPMNDALCYCTFTFHVTNKRTVGKISAWILEGVDDSVKKKRGGSRRGRSSLAGMLDLDMFADGTTYDDIDYALSSGDFSMLL
jgi:hypothetical protein